LVFIRTCVAPLEKLKLEYIVRGEKRNIFELIQSIATSQGLRGFWKGNLLNILRTAPFKSVNFSAYDTYRKNYLYSLGMRKLPILRRLLLVLLLGSLLLIFACHSTLYVVISNLKHDFLVYFYLLLSNRWLQTSLPMIPGKFIQSNLYAWLRTFPVEEPLTLFCYCDFNIFSL
jgi:hypothetical protein